VPAPSRRLRKPYRYPDVKKGRTSFVGNHGSSQEDYQGSERPSATTNGPNLFAAHQFTPGPLVGSSQNQRLMRLIPIIVAASRLIRTPYRKYEPELRHEARHCCCCLGSRMRSRRWACGISIRRQLPPASGTRSRRPGGISATESPRVVANTNVGRIDGGLRSFACRLAQTNAVPEAFRGADVPLATAAIVS
jgi:hypothetical protein